MSITKLSTLGMTRKEWLKERLTSLGGSDAAAILNLNEYSSPLQVWLEKTGQRLGFEGNIATETGTYLEPYIADLFTRETGKKVRRVNAIIRNDEYPFAHANIDREVVGEKALLEIKSTTSYKNMKLARDGDYPEQWYVQCMHYMMVTGYSKAYLAALLNNRDFQVHVIHRNEGEIEALAEAEAAFWDKVLKMEQPVPNGSEGDADALNWMIGTGDSDIPPIDLFGSSGIIAEYLELNDSIKALDRRKEEIKQILCQQLGKAEVGLAGENKVTWRTYTSTRFDRKAFEAANPRIDLSPWTKTTEARRFDIK
jgi:putative phage-type endonuclease